jgi:hypothetical protein
MLSARRNLTSDRPDISNQKQQPKKTDGDRAFNLLLKKKVITCWLE